MEQGKLQRPMGDRDEAFYLKIAEYYYGMYATDECHFGFGGILRGRSIVELRDRARGNYYINKYMDMLDPVRKRGKAKGRRRWNISWDPVRILPKFRNIVKTRLSDVSLQPKTVAADSTAQIERLAVKNYATLLRQPEMQMFLQSSGATIADDTGLGGMSTEEIDMTYKMGGIRLPVEIAMKDAIDKVMLNSDYKTVLQGMLIDDIVDFNLACTDTVNLNGSETVNYVDPYGLIIGKSAYPDFRDCGFRGYVEEKSLSTIRAEAPDLDLDTIRQKVIGAYRRHVNSVTGFRRDYTSQTSDVSVYVMKMYFLDTDYKRYLTGRHRSGGLIFDEVPEDFKLTPRMEKNGKRIDVKAIEKLYQVYWIVGTDIVYNYGVVDFTVRKGDPGNKKIVWPMQIYAGEGASIVESCIAVDDDLQLSNYKIRHLLAKVPPAPRMILYMNMVKDSIQIDNEEIPISEILADYQSEGIMLLDQTQSYTMPGEEGYGRRPVDFIPSGIREDFEIERVRFQDCIQSIRSITGINEIADGSTAKANLLQGVMMGLQQATNSALKPLVNALSSHYVQICTYAVHKFKTMLIDGDIDLGYVPVLQDYSRTIKLTKEMAKYDWHISVEIETGEMLQLLIQDIMQRKDMIPPDSYFLILRAIEDGDILKAQYMLAVSVDKAQKQAHQRQMELVQAQTQGNQQAAQMNSQAQAQLLQMKAEVEAQMKQIDAALQAERDKALHEQTKELEQLKGSMKFETSVASIRENNQNRFTQ